MPETRAWWLLIVALLVVAAAWKHRRIGLAAGLILIAVGMAVALWGVPHLRDPLVLMRLKAFDYEQPQQPGMYAIAAGGVLVIVGVVTVRGYIRRRD